MNIVQNSCLEIKENKLSYDKSFIKISNISQAFVKEEEKITYSIFAFLCAIIGFILFTKPNTFWVGIIFLAFSILRIFPTFIKNANKKYILVLVINSGGSVGFRCKDENFLL